MTEPIGLAAVLDDKDFQAGLSRYTKGLSTAEHATDKTAGGIGKAFGSAGNVLGGVFHAGTVVAVAGVAALAAGVVALGAVVHQSLDAATKWGGQVDTLGDVMGLSGEDASKFAFAMNRVGVSVDEGGAALNFFTRNLADLGAAAKPPTVSIKDNSAAIEKLNDQIADAEIKLARANKRLSEAKEPTDSMRYAVEDASKKVAELNEKLAGTPASVTSMSEAKAKISPLGEALTKLGIDAKDSQGKLKSFDAIMPEIMDAFQKLPAGVDASALAMEMFGPRGGTKFLDLLRGGSSGLEDAARKAKEFGLSLDSEASDAIEQFGFAQNELNLAMQGFFVQIGIAVMPLLQEMVSFISGEVMPTVIAWAKNAMPTIIAAVRELVVWLRDNVLPHLIKFAGFVVEHVVPAIQAFVGFIVEHLPTVIGWFKSLFQGGQQAAGGITDAFPKIQAVIGAVWSFIQPILAAVFTELSKFWTEIQPKLAAAWENIQKVTTEVFGAIVKFIQEHWTEIRNIFEGAWKIIQGIVQVAWSLISGIIKIALDLIAGDFEAAGVSFQDMMREIWGGIQLIIGGAWQAIQGLAKLALDTLGQIIFDKLGVIRGWFQQKFDEVVAWLRGLPGQFYDLGASIVQGLIDSFWDSAGAIQDALAGIIQAAIDNLWLLLTGGGGESSPLQFGAVERSASAVAQISARGFNMATMRTAPMLSGAGLGSSNSTSTSLQVNFYGSGGPDSQADAELKTSWILNAMKARGVEF